MVLQNAYKLKGSSFGISEQYPAEINNRGKNLYPIMNGGKTTTTSCGACARPAVH
jgi:hypothetical protein